MQEFPELEGQSEFVEQKAKAEQDMVAKKVEESKQVEEEPSLGNLQSAAGGKRKRKGGKGNANVVEQKIKVGFF